MNTFGGILLVLFFSANGYSQTDTLHIYFPTDVYSLDSASIKFLSDQQKELKRKKFLLVTGYADERGDIPYNNTLSYKRANSVAEAVQALGIPAERIKLVEGRGEVSRTNGNMQLYEKDRRVDIAEDIEKRKTDTIGMPELPDMIKSTPVGEAVILNNVYFYLGSTEMMNSSIPTLNALLRIMRDNPTLKIRLEGHICCVPPGEESIYRDPGLRLSYYRAAAIKTYLSDNGIEEGRMDATGFGMDYPLVKNEITEEDRKSNRRVEVRIVAR